MFTASSLPAAVIPDNHVHGEMADPDASLMQEACSHSPGAFGSLVQRHQQSLLNFFSRHGAREESEDLVQETFIRLFRYRDRYQPTARFSTFLYTLARHAWVDHGRKTARRERFAEKYERELAVSAAEFVAEVNAGHDIGSAIAELSPKLRQIVEMHFYEGLCYHEIADRIGVPLGTVKSRMSLAMKALRAMPAFQKGHGEQATKPAPRCLRSIHLSAFQYLAPILPLLMNFREIA